MIELMSDEMMTMMRSPSKLLSQIGSVPNPVKELDQVVVLAGEFSKASRLLMRRKNNKIQPNQ
jgi:hypothetical protein